MGFEVRVNGEKVAFCEEQVTGFHVMSPRGELFAGGISTEGVIDIVLDKVTAGGPVRLDQLDALQLATQSAQREGELAGNAPVVVGHDMNVTQGGLAGDTPNYPPPSHDLSEGLSPNDGETLTIRIEEYFTHGDARRAIDENPAGAASTGPQTAEQGATTSPAPPPTPPSETTSTTGSSDAPTDTGASTSSSSAPVLTLSSPDASPAPASGSESTTGSDAQTETQTGPATGPVDTGTSGGSSAPVPPPA